MITIHDKHEQNFARNGYGEISDYIIQPKVSWKMNGEFKLSFTHPKFARLSKYMLRENIIKVPVPYMNERQLFRIYRAIDKLGYIEVEAKHIFYDLATNMIEDINVVNRDGQDAIERVLSGAVLPHRFFGHSDIETLSGMRVVRYNPVEALLDDGKSNTFVSRWGGQLYRDNFNIYMNRRIGSDKGIVIEYKKDLLDFESPIDYSQITNRLMPIGFDGLMLPEKYIDAPDIDLTDVRIGIVRYQNVKAAIGEYEDDEDAIPLEDAYAELRRLAMEEFTINNVDKPRVNIKVDFATLDNTIEYKHLDLLQEIHQGDTVRIKISDESEDKEFISNVVAFESDPLQKNHYISVTLGSIADTLTSQTNHEVKRLENSMDSQLAISLNRIETVSQAVGRKTSSYHGVVSPLQVNFDNLRPGDTFFQKNGEYFAIWEYREVNGVLQWTRHVDTYFGIQVENNINDMLDRMDSDKANLEDEIDQALASAKSYADQQSTSLESSLGSLIDAAQTTANEAKQDAINKATQALTDAKTYADSQISTLNTDLSNIIAGAQVDIGDIESQINNAISTSQSANNLRDLFIETRDDIGGLSTTVQSKADSSVVTNLATLVSTKVSNADFTAQISALATDINLRVKSDSIINQVNISTEGIRIAGNKTHISGTTLIDNTAIKDAHIESLNATKINAGTINSARINSTEIVTQGLAANVIQSTHLASTTALIDKIFSTTAMITQLTTKTAFINNIQAIDISATRITSGTINSARINSAEIVTQGLVANVVKSTHISADAALFNKLFSTTMATNRLAARSAWIKDVNIANAEISGAKIKDATIGGAKIMEATINDAHIQTLSVSKITGDTSSFVKSIWNSYSSSLEIDSVGLIIKTRNSFQVHLDNYGVSFKKYVSGSTQSLGLLTSQTANHTNQIDFDVTTTNVSALSAENNAFVALGYRGNYTMGSDNWEYSLVINGTTGLMTFASDILFDKFGPSSGPVDVWLNNARFHPEFNLAEWQQGSGTRIDSYFTFNAGSHVYGGTNPYKGVGMKSGQGKGTGIVLLDNGIVAAFSDDSPILNNSAHPTGSLAGKSIYGSLVNINRPKIELIPESNPSDLHINVSISGYGWRRVSLASLVLAAINGTKLAVPPASPT